MRAFSRVSGAMAGAASVVLLVALTSAPASALVAPVSAGPPKPPKAAHLDFNGFFPSANRVHVGDSISFAINGFHTVSFLAKGQVPPPLIILAPSSPISGKLDGAGAPFWFNGQPSQVINPLVAAPSGGKKYAGKGFLNSGLPAPSGPPKPFVVKFTKAGTFTFNCLVHPGMKGTVRVLPKSRPVPSAKLDGATAKAEERAASAQALLLRKVKPAANTVLAGNDGTGPVAWLRFFPQSLKVKAGTAVEFKISSSREVHTITFGPAAYLAEIENTFTTPQPSPGGPPTLIVNPLGAYPSDPPPLPAFTGANHGNGFEGSGVLSNGGGPLPSAVKITFTKPGVYGFDCVIHPSMHGTITVTK
jgi:plastocyanin